MRAIPSEPTKKQKIASEKKIQDVEPVERVYREEVTDLNKSTGGKGERKDGDELKTESPLMQKRKQKKENEKRTGSVK